MTPSEVILKSYESFAPGDMATPAYFCAEAKVDAVVENKLIRRKINNVTRK